jgi:hypothetical protein
MRRRVEASSNLEHSEVFWGLDGLVPQEYIGRLCLTFCNDEPLVGRTRRVETFECVRSDSHADGQTRDTMS